MLGGTWFKNSISVVRILFGIQYILSGFNWYVKIFPFPSSVDPLVAHYKDPIMGAMIQSGWMLYLVKSIELLTGLSLLFNIFVPLMMVVSFPIALTTFLFDAFIIQYVWGWFLGKVSGPFVLAKILDMVYFGGVVLWMQGYLMISYLRNHYRPLFSIRGSAELP